MGVAGVAVAFARAWVSHNQPAAAWRAGIDRYCTPAMVTAFSYADPARVPASKVVGPPVLGATADGRVGVSIATDTADLLLQLVHHGRWLVDSVSTAG